MNRYPTRSLLVVFFLLVACSGSSGGTIADVGDADVGETDVECGCGIEQRCVDGVCESVADCNDECGADQVCARPGVCRAIDGFCNRGTDCALGDLCVANQCVPNDVAPDVDSAWGAITCGGIAVSDRTAGDYDGDGFRDGIASSYVTTGDWCEYIEMETRVLLLEQHVAGEMRLWVGTRDFDGGAETIETLRAGDGIVGLDRRSQPLGVFPLRPGLRTDRASARLLLPYVGELSPPTLTVWYSLPLTWATFFGELQVSDRGLETPVADPSDFRDSDFYLHAVVHLDDLFAAVDATMQSCDCDPPINEPPVLWRELAEGLFGPTPVARCGLRESASCTPDDTVCDHSESLCGFGYRANRAAEVDVDLDGFGDSIPVGFQLVVSPVAVELIE